MLSETTVTRIARLLWAERRPAETISWAQMSFDARAPWETLAVVALDAARGLRERIAEQGEANHG